MDILGFGNNLKKSLRVENFYAYSYDHFNMEAHKHFSAEIMYVASGDCEIYLPDEKRRIRMKKDQFVLLNSLIPHKLIITSKCRILNLELRPCDDGIDFVAAIQGSPDLHEFYRDLPDYLVCKDTANLSECINATHKELTAIHNTASTLQAQVRLLEILVLVARCYNSTKTDNSFFIARALDYIKENFAENLTIADIAKAVGLNPIYLQRIYKKDTGSTLLTEINSTRITQAKKMIENTPLALTDIAFRCGFNSRQSFYEVFKKHQNISPAEYRKSIQNSTEKQTPFTKA